MIDKIENVKNEERNKYLNKSSILKLIPYAILQSVLMYALYYLAKYLNKLLDRKNFFLSNLILYLTQSKFFLMILVSSISIVITEIYKHYEKKKNRQATYKNHTKSLIQCILTPTLAFVLILQILSTIIREIRDLSLEKVKYIEFALLPLLIIALYKLSSQLIKIVRDQLQESKKQSIFKTIKKSVNWTRFCASILIFTICSTLIYQFFFQNENVESFLEAIDSFLTINIDNYKLKIFSSKFFLTILIEIILFFIIELAVCHGLKLIDNHYQKKKQCDNYQKQEQEKSTVNHDKEEKKYKVNGRYISGLFFKFVFAASFTLFLSSCSTIYSMDLEGLKNPKILALMIFFLSISLLCVFYGQNYMNKDDKNIIEELSQYIKFPKSILNFFEIKAEEMKIEVIHQI